MKTIRQRWHIVAVSVLILVLGQALLHGADGSGTGVTGLRNSKIFVHDMAPIDIDAVRDVALIDWSGKNNRLLFSKRSINQYYNVFSCTPEGFRLTSLTLDRNRSSTQLHNTSASWHPSGKFFVFSGQNRGSTDARRSGPDGGWHCNLWLALSDGSQFWQLTDIPTRYNNPQGATMPVFSPDGTKLFWTGFPDDSGGRSPYENRALFVADFVMEGKTPTLKDQQRFTPGTRDDFYESYGFSPSGERILFAANMESGQPWFCMDICHIDRDQAEPKVLSGNPGGWDRYAAYSPDGKKIVWSSSRTFSIPFLGQGGTAWQRYLRSELWIMDADGGSARQLTFFNTNTAREYAGRRTFIGDSAWSADGKRLAVVVHRETRSFDVSSRIYIMTLGEGKPRTRSPGDDAGGQRRRGIVIP